jgi:hypothetical protein
MHDDRQAAKSNSLSPRGKLGMKLALAGFIAVAAYLLLTEHRAHLFGILPYLLLLLCPLLHFFTHGRHGGHCVGHSGATEKTEKHDR